MRAQASIAITRTTFSRSIFLFLRHLAHNARRIAGHRLTQHVKARHDTQTGLLRCSHASINNFEPSISRLQNNHISTLQHRPQIMRRNRLAQMDYRRKSNV